MRIRVEEGPRLVRLRADEAAPLCEWVVSRLADGYVSCTAMEMRASGPVAVGQLVWPEDMATDTALLDALDCFRAKVDSSPPLKAATIRKVKLWDTLAGPDDVGRGPRGGSLAARDFTTLGGAKAVDWVRESAARRPGPAGRTDAFYAHVAALYVDRPSRTALADLAAQLDRPTAHVRQILATARERGLLTAAPIGRAGGRLTQTAIAEALPEHIRLMRKLAKGNR